MADEANLIGPDEPAFRLELTAAQLKVTHTALRALYDDLGHEERDVQGVVREVLSKLPDQDAIRAIDLSGRARPPPRQRRLVTPWRMPAPRAAGRPVRYGGSDRRRDHHDAHPGPHGPAATGLAGTGSSYSAWAPCGSSTASRSPSSAPSRAACRTSRRSRSAPFDTLGGILLHHRRLRSAPSASAISPTASGARSSSSSRSPSTSRRRWRRPSRGAPRLLGSSAAHRPGHRRRVRGHQLRHRRAHPRAGARAGSTSRSTAPTGSGPPVGAALSLRAARRRASSRSTSAGGWPSGSAWPWGPGHHVRAPQRPREPALADHPRPRGARPSVLVSSIEERVKRETGQRELDDSGRSRSRSSHARPPTSSRRRARCSSAIRGARSLGFTLMATQALIYNAVIFTFSIVLTTFFNVSDCGRARLPDPVRDRATSLGALLLGPALRHGRTAADDRRHLPHLPPSACSCSGSCSTTARSGLGGLHGRLCAGRSSSPPRRRRPAI